MQFCADVSANFVHFVFSVGFERNMHFFVNEVGLENFVKVNGFAYVFENW